MTCLNLLKNIMVEDILTLRAFVQQMKSFYLTGTMLSAIVGEKTGGNAMFGKFQDSLLFVVLAYAIFRIGWGEGFTTMNIFILLGSLVAILSMVLRRSGYLETVEKKKKEAEEKKKNV